MKVFVTGATGFVGEEIVRQLHEAGHSLRLLVRHSASSRAHALVSRYVAEVHPGDVTNASSLLHALDNMEAVIHLVGIISEVGPSTFENVHTRGTQHLVAAAQKAGVQRFIHMSALGTRPHAPSRYHQTKWAAEEAVRHSRLAYTIFRPSLIYGRHDHFVNLFAQIIRRSPVVPLLGNGLTRFQPVGVEVVATAFVRALAQPTAIGQTYDLAGPEVLTLEELLDQMLEAMGRRRWKLRLPLSLAQGQAALLENLYPRLLHKAPPLNREQLIMLQEDNVGNAAPANELFGLQPGRFREGIQTYLA